MYEAFIWLKLNKNINNNDKKIGGCEILTNGLYYMTYVSPDPDKPLKYCLFLSFVVVFSQVSYIRKLKINFYQKISNYDQWLHIEIFIYYFNVTVSTSSMSSFELLYKGIKIKLTETNYVNKYILRLLTRYLKFFIFIIKLWFNFKI